MNIDNEFSLSDTVYLKTDPEQNKRIVIGIWIRQDGLQYELAMSEESSYHFDYEISREVDKAMEFNKKFQ